MDTPSAQVSKAIHPAAKMCMPTAGCILNFEHSTVSALLTENIVVMMYPFLFLHYAKLLQQLLTHIWITENLRAVLSMSFCESMHGHSSAQLIINYNLEAK